MARNGKIISIHSFRGGTGKSNTTANLAVMLARSGKRVAVVDTDIQSPGVHVLFGVAEENRHATLNDYLWERCRIEDAALDVTPPPVAEESGKILLIPSSLTPGDIARVLREGYDIDRLHDGFLELLETLELDFLLIDTHPGLNEETLLSIALSQVLIVVLRPDQQDFLGTAVTLDVARKLEVAKIMLVVNKVLARLDVEKLKNQVESAFNADVAVMLPESEDILALGSRDLFCLVYPDHEYTVTLRDLAERLLSA